jgi:hypothetical protein
MRPPAHYSASPLPSFATRPPYAVRPPTFAESLRALWRWWRPRPVPLRVLFAEARVVERLAAELEEADAASPMPDTPPNSKAKAKVKRAATPSRR